MLCSSSIRRSWLLTAILAAGCLASCVSAPARTAAPVQETREKVSSFGEYAGYSEPAYDGWSRSSRYVTVSDGTRIAVDVIRPTRAGKVATERLPVVWTHHRYRCAEFDAGEGKTYTVLDTFEWLPEVLRHGYVVACADARGSGASFGTFEGMFNPRETQDAYDIIEWLGTQSWSNGNVGMYGRSYLGMTQYMAAGRKPPHLKALFPEVAGTDMYELLYKGGIYHGPFIEMWSNVVRQLDVDEPAPPVDDDRDGALLAAAVEQHKSNRNAAELYAGLPYRDSVDRRSGAVPFRDWTPITYFKEIRESNVPVYYLAGWYDRYVRDQLIAYRNLSNPQRLSIGPWTHTQSDQFNSAAEHLRWWDYWLKGIDNGVMREDPVHYYVMGAPKDRAWRSAPTWPLPQEKRTAYWFGSNGSLGTEAPRARGAKDEFTVDYTASIEPNPRWSLEREFPELSANDAKGLTYTTPPLTAPLEVTGHPVVHLWLSSSAPDADLFVYLEEVDEKGSSRYVTEGMLRASNRATADPGYNLLGLPYHRGLKSDRADLPPGQPVELVIELFPTSTLFQAGHRLRVTITGADKANARTPEQNPPPRLSVWRE
ncbi:MAG TPA: CocE/NonD family hydrolase, partial [Thermoanaerobaculia bacterium]|nr:CocE/NonD family hydrolase [Thermoanaerobaculia bacterium]